MAGLYYLNCVGHSRYSNWQFGLYAFTPTLLDSAVSSAWSAALYQFFVTGDITAVGFRNGMGTAAAVDTATVYAVDQATDRKTPVARASLGFAGIQDTAVEVCNTVSVLVYLRPAAITNRNTGRMYMPPLAYDSLGEVVDATAQALYRDQWKQAWNQMTGDLLFPVIRNRTRHSHELAATYAIAAKFGHCPTRRDPRKLADLSGTI